MRDADNAVCAEVVHVAIGAWEAHVGVGGGFVVHVVDGEAVGEGRWNGWKEGFVGLGLGLGLVFGGGGRGWGGLVVWLGWFFGLCGFCFFFFFLLLLLLLLLRFRLFLVGLVRWACFFRGRACPVGEA